MKLITDCKRQHANTPTRRSVSPGRRHADPFLQKFVFDKKPIRGTG